LHVRCPDSPVWFSSLTDIKILPIRSGWKLSSVPCSQPPSCYDLVYPPDACSFRKLRTCDWTAFIFILFSPFLHLVSCRYSPLNDYLLPLFFFERVFRWLTVAVSRPIFFFSRAKLCNPGRSHFRDFFFLSSFSDRPFRETPLFSFLNTLDVSGRRTFFLFLVVLLPWGSVHDRWFSLWLNAHPGNSLRDCPSACRFFVSRPQRPPFSSRSVLISFRPPRPFSRGSPFLPVCRRSGEVSCASDRPP